MLHYVALDTRKRVPFMWALSALMNKILMLITTTLVVSCSSKYEVKVPETDLEISINNRNQGSVTTEKCIVQYKSEQYQNIKIWFSENKSGWKQRPATYFPDKGIYDGKGFAVNISGGLVVIGELYTRPSDEKLERLISCL